MPSLESYASTNEGKQDFAGIYNRPDARTYFQTLKRVDYAIPEVAKPIFRGLLGDLRARRNGGGDGGLLKVLDLGCSYGVNAAMLKYDFTMEGLYNYYDRGEERPFDEAVQQDRHYFGRQDGDQELNVIGLDEADRAVDYGIATGLLDDGVAANLETSPLGNGDAEKIKGCDLVTSTGCVGYVTDRTFRQLLSRLNDRPRPWFANFVLRMFRYEPIAEVLSDAGYVTRKLEGALFAQRRFASIEEREAASEAIQQLELDPETELTTDRYYAEFFLSQPAEEADSVPLERLARWAQEAQGAQGAEGPAGQQIP